MKVAPGVSHHPLKFTLPLSVTAYAGTYQIRSSKQIGDASTPGSENTRVRLRAPIPERRMRGSTRSDPRIVDTRRKDRRSQAPPPKNANAATCASQNASVVSAGYAFKKHASECGEVGITRKWIFCSTPPITGECLRRGAKSACRMALAACDQWHEHLPLGRCLAAKIPVLHSARPCRKLGSVAGDVRGLGHHDLLAPPTCRFTTGLDVRQQWTRTPRRCRARTPAISKPR